MGVAAIAFAGTIAEKNWCLAPRKLMRTISADQKSGVLVSTVGVFGSAFLWLLGFKAVALWMGPEGVGLFSQLRQMAQAATVGATFGGTNSVVQGLSERGDEGARRQFRATAVRLVGSAGLLMVLGVLAAATPLTQFFLSSGAPELVATVRWLAVAVLLNIAGTYALAVLNGYRSYPYLALAQIAGPAALVLLLAAAWWWRWPPDPLLLVASFVACFGITCLAGLWGGVAPAATPRHSEHGTTGQRRAPNFSALRIVESGCCAFDHSGSAADPFLGDRGGRPCLWRFVRRRVDIDVQLHHAFSHGLQCDLPAASHPCHNA